MLDYLPTDDEPKKKKLAAIKKMPFDFDKELRSSFSNKMKYDGDRTAKEVLLSAASKGKIDPSFLLSSAWQEGMNKAVLNPDIVSAGYNIASKSDPSINDYPVDGFLNYGTDTFGDRYEQLKKYLPEGFEQRFKLYGAENEKKEKIRTAAFRTNEDALIAKSAFLNYERDGVINYAKSKGVDLDEKSSQYFTLAAYNGGSGSAHKMINEYSKSKDKSAFIDKGLSTLKEVHKNISPRLARMKLAQELLKENAPASMVKAVLKG